ncbi:MAG: class II D-tagatose-bisphosphate aldolase, non-catalytic subunit [Clostridiales bacterium]|nr:class II D-tagatose-bisphosphate aldolase, non-catalytic subunit [Clostridiales bacterium]
MMHPLKAIFSGQVQGQSGIFSVCTANPLALRSAMLHAKRHNYYIAIEATANQVNQFGGYTGMKPKDYAALIEAIRRQVGLSKEQLVLGGDHLGPLTWQDLPEKEAMENSKALVWDFTLAGFTKIHLDTSMRVADDDQNAPLDVQICARRGAVLANCVKEAYETLKKDNPAAVRPVLVIGSEVPIPGGSQEHEDSITPTAPEEFLRQYRIFKEEFEKAKAPFEDVVAFVVQAGVEFGDDFVFQYSSENAAALCAALKEAEPLVFEGHSTDYQQEQSLKNMVRDGIGVLKVGPALTFALRESLFLLEECESIIVKDPAQHSAVKASILKEMDADDKYWKKYYQGTKDEVEFKKLYSYSDRCRYYLPVSSVASSIDRLLENTENVPVALISQYFPRQYEKVVRGDLGQDGLSLILDRIGDWYDIYAAACGILL